MTTFGYTVVASAATHRSAVRGQVPGVSDSVCRPSSHRILPRSARVMVAVTSRLNLSRLVCKLHTQANNSPPRGQLLAHSDSRRNSLCGGIRSALRLAMRSETNAAGYH
jgi:hypothetical protein